MVLVTGWLLVVTHLIDPDSVASDQLNTIEIPRSGSRK